MQFAFDADFLLWIQEHLRCDFLNYIFPNITVLGNAGIFWILLTAVLLCFKKTRRAAICSLFALLGSIGKRATDPSFPSGHTAASIASAVALCRFLKKRYSIPLVALALMIGFSRLYIGIHYPTDVIVGLIDGILLGILGCLIENQMHKKWAWYAEMCDGEKAENQDSTQVE